MRLFNPIQNRSDYIKEQIQRSQEKFDYCKVSINHVEKFFKIIEKHKKPHGPCICMGTRNGREVDLFRIIFKSNVFFKNLIKIFEIKRYGWKSILPVIESFGRSRINNFNNDSFIGVEINPDGKRPDIHIGSFDELPKPWENTFSILYSNSFDQSLDPKKTASEWIRIMKNNGIIIIGFCYTEPTLSDPVGELDFQDFQELFPGEILFFEKQSSNYDEIIIMLNKPR